MTCCRLVLHCKSLASCSTLQGAPTENANPLDHESNESFLHVRREVGRTWVFVTSSAFRHVLSPSESSIEGSTMEMAGGEGHSSSLSQIVRAALEGKLFYSNLIPPFWQRCNTSLLHAGVPSGATRGTSKSLKIHCDVDEQKFSLITMHRKLFWYWAKVELT